MDKPRATTLEFAAILGEAIGRAYLAGKNANAPVDDDRGVRDLLLFTEGETLDGDYTTPHSLR